MIPLEITHTVRVKEPILNFLKERSSKPFLNALLTMLLEYKRMYLEVCGFEDSPIHDPCAINYIINPDWFEVKKVNGG
jgi:inosine-uridine nucleoside N-ribohydrolase